MMRISGTILVAGSMLLGASAPALAQNCATVHQVSITYTFEPGDIYIKAGDCVRWTNIHVIEHSAIGMEREFNTGVLMPGTSALLEFGEPEVFPYVCGVHPIMTGVLIVE